MTVIGLIGGIGSGKSLVSQVFAEQGAVVISGDDAGHEALRQSEIMHQIELRWGRSVFNEQGEVDRRALGIRVFRDPAERKELEAIVFPWIKRRLSDQLAAARERGDDRLVVLDAAVMLEAGWDRLCDVIVYVHAPRLLRLGRLAKQRGWSSQEVEARERAQLSLTDKATRADFVVENTGERALVVRQVALLLQHWSHKL